MQFPLLSHLSGVFSEKKLRQLSDYLAKIKTHPKGFKGVVASAVGKQLKIDEQEALIMLHMAHKVGVLSSPLYMIYDPHSQELIGKYNSYGEIPESVPASPWGPCKGDINRDELGVRLVFRINPEA